MIKKNIIPILVLFVGIVLLFGNTLFPGKDQIIYGGDLQDQFYYWKSFYKESLVRGVVPFWNPYSFSGMPFLAHPSTAAFYPLNGIFLLFPLQVAFSLFLFVHVLIAGSGMYWYGIKKWDRVTALTAAFMFSFSGMFAARVFSGHIDIISTLAWIPFVCGSLQDVINHPKRRSIVLSIIFLSLQILAGYQFVVLSTLLFSFFYFICHSLISFFHLKRKKELIRSVVSYVLVIFISFGISAVQLLPTFQLVHESIRKNGLPYELTTWGSYFYDTFKLYADPFAFGNPLPEKYSYFGPGPNYYELNYFVGRIPLLVIGIYLVYQLTLLFRKKKYDIFFFFCVVSLLFYFGMALGNNFFLHKLFYILFPPFRLFRFPAQYLFLSVFILPVLFGISLSRLKYSFIKIILLCFIVSELFLFSKPFYRLTSLPTKDFDPGLVKTISDTSSLFRSIPDFPVISYVRKAMDFESATLYKVYSTGGYNPIILNNYYRFIASTNGINIDALKSFNVEVPPPDPNKNGVNYLNAKYILYDPAWNTFYRGVPSNYSQKIKTPLYTLYENAKALPRFYLVHTVNTLPTQRELEEVLKNDLDLSKSAYLVSDKKKSESNLFSLCSSLGNDSVAVLSFELNSIRLKSNSDCNAMLVSSEVAYPGWKARVDGKNVPVETINLAFRGIFLPKGSHTIIMYYQPTIYIFGLVISIISLICFCFIVRKIKFVF